MKVLAALILLMLAGCATSIDVDLHKINAWSTQDSVIITSSLSQLIDTKGELAFVMAHELGHIILLHHSRNPKPGDELDADRFAFQSMVIAGHSPCYGISAMSKIVNAIGAEGPGFRNRLDYWSKRFSKCEVP